MIHTEWREPTIILTKSRDEVTPAARRALDYSLAVMILLLGLSCAADMPRWAAANNPNTGTRFIPVELWSGAEWDGTHVIRMSKAGHIFGQRGEKEIIGPFEWTRPRTGEKLLVYERTNGDKRQLFTITNDGTGLGRVYDSRYDRDCVNEVKFPLGSWKQGETRVYEVQCNGFRKPRQLRVTIRELDFVYQGVPHSLRFHWLIDEGRGRGDRHDLHVQSRQRTRERRGERIASPFEESDLSTLWGQTFTPIISLLPHTSIVNLAAPIDTVSESLKQSSRFKDSTPANRSS